MTGNMTEAVGGDGEGQSGGDEVREMGGNQGSHRIMYGLEDSKVKSGFHSKCNGKS